jgi:hypothetical protein
MKYNPFGPCLPGDPGPKERDPQEEICQELNRTLK